MTKPEFPKKRGPRGPDGFDRHRDLRTLGGIQLDTALLLFARFGSLRWPVLAQMLWPDSDVSSQTVLCRRMFDRLVEEDYCHRITGWGDDAFILTPTGARRIQWLLPDAYSTLRSGVRLRSVKGATWQHRRAGDIYLATRHAAGHEIATEYEAYTSSPYSKIASEYLPSEIKRNDGVYYTVRFPDHPGSREVTGIRIVEVVRNAPKQSRSQQEAHDEMFALLDNMRRLTAMGIGFDLLFDDDAQGQSAASEIDRAAAARCINFDVRLVQRVWMRAQRDNKGPVDFRPEPWPSTASTKAGAASPDAPQLHKRPAAPKQQSFRIVLDQSASGNREIEIRYLPADLILRGHTLGFGNEGYIQFDEYDDADNPMFWKAVVVPNDIDLDDLDQREDLFRKLMVMLAAAGRIKG